MKISEIRSLLCESFLIEMFHLFQNVESTFFYTTSIFLDAIFDYFNPPTKKINVVSEGKQMK